MDCALNLVRDSDHDELLGLEIDITVIRCFAQRTVTALPSIIATRYGEVRLTSGYYDYSD
jgi:hypothetical protein